MPIEPDGSVSVRVPANVAFVISVLDKDGRRLFPPHRNWLQLRPGETRTCNGCPQAAAAGAVDQSHGRDGTSVSAWAGAPATGVPFAGTVATYSPNLAETMAQTRARTSCKAGSVCSQLLSVNPTYDDVWTDAVAAARAPDASFSYAYNAPVPTGLTTLAPTTPGCQTTWSSICRIVINYVQHIHPLWSAPRINGAVDNTCTSCHSPVDVLNANAPRVPAGQLDLSDGDSQDEPLQKSAYRELLFADNEQELNGGVLLDRLATTIDPDTGLPVQSPVTVTASMAATNARNSRFFRKFADGSGTVDHRAFLTPAELRLLSEWVDIGAQYFNNPFDPAVPLN